MNEYETLLARGGLSLDRLATLCRVVDAGGLSRAAECDASRLSLYSRQVKDLETFFGAPLLRKVGRTVVPTEAAQALAKAARAQFKTLQSFVGGESPAASFTLGASHSLLEWFIMPRLDAICAALGRQRSLRLLSMRSRELVQAIENHQVDFGLVRADSVPRGLVTKELVRMEYALFVPRALAGTRKPRQILREVPLAIALGGRLREQIEAAAEKEGMKLSFALECATFTLAADAVRGGGYAAILPDIAAGSLAKADESRLSIPLRIEPDRMIVAAWHRSTSTTTLKPVLSALQAR